MSDRPNLHFAWKRPAKFALVGGMGIIVQLVALHWLAETGCGYLIATIISVEAAVVHNFVWHEKFTWSDRSGLTSVRLGSRIVRFHLSNGLISIVGNLLLMRIFVGEFGMPLIPANLLSITACCLTNFVASDRWVFVIASSAAGTRGTRPQ